MRITRELLLKNAEDTVAARTENDPNIIGAFLHGSLLSPDPLLGGTTDIDLTFVYDVGQERREFVRLSNEIHLDIMHHPKDKYANGRGLREVAWEGSTIFDCRIMYDPKHFLDFTQANVRGLFERPDTTLSRALPLLESARQAWLRINDQVGDPDVNRLREYLNALQQTVNSLACLSGAPLTERRLLLDFPQRALALGQEGLPVGLIGLLGGNPLSAETMQDWLPAWESAFDAAVENQPEQVGLHAFQKRYYLSAIKAMLASENPRAALWPLLRTWTRAVNSMGDKGEHLSAWMNACDELNLLGDHFVGKLAGFDAYLDTVEALFAAWRGERGI